MPEILWRALKDHSGVLNGGELGGRQIGKLLPVAIPLENTVGTVKKVSWHERLVEGKEGGRACVDRRMRYTALQPAQPSTGK
jgi:hypothetical protein